MADIVKPSSPPFLFTYWNPFSRDSNLVESWFDYVKNVSLAKYAAQSVVRYTQEASSDQMRAVDTVGERICGSLYTGFPALDSHLSLISGELERISGAFDGVNQRLDLLLDEAKTSNLLQENIAELLRIPDSQKQRQHHIEMGLKFLKNALNDEDLYQDALHELLEAEKLMPYDYFVLHRIGMIYLYVPRHGNLEKATVYFTKAAKYAAVESDPKADRLSSVLNKRVAERFSAQAELTASNISTLAAESYLQAAAALYALGRFSEAATMAEKAVKHAPEEAKHRFFFAKYLVRSGNPDAAVPELKKAVELAPAMALAAVADFDLNRVQAVLDLLTRFDADATAELKKRIEILHESPRSGYRPQGLQQVRNQAQIALEKGNYAEKASLISRLTPFAVWLGEVAAFGIPFNTASAAALIQSATPEFLELEWSKRILAGFCLSAKLQKVAERPNPSFPERVLLATAEGEFRAYHDRFLVEGCIKGWLSHHRSAELSDVEIFNLMFHMDNEDSPPGWMITAKRSIRELVANGIIRSLGKRRLGYDEYSFFDMPLALGLVYPKIQPENYGRGTYVTADGITVDPEEKIYELDCIIHSRYEYDDEEVDGFDHEKDDKGHTLDYEGKRDYVGEATYHLSMEGFSLAMYAFHDGPDFLVGRAEDDDPKKRWELITFRGLPLEILQALTVDKDPDVRRKALVCWRWRTTRANRQPETGRT